MDMELGEQQLLQKGSAKLQHLTAPGQVSWHVDTQGEQPVVSPTWIESVELGIKKGTHLKKLGLISL